MSEKNRTLQGAALDEALKRLEDGLKPRQDAPGRTNRPPKAIRPGGSPERLLTAVRKYYGPLTLTGLVFAAWQEYPETFGMAGVEKDYPSDNKVRVCLFGKRGLIARGLIRKRGDGLYEVTEQGRANFK